MNSRECRGLDHGGIRVLGSRAVTRASVVVIPLALIILGCSAEVPPITPTPAFRALTPSALPSVTLPPSVETATLPPISNCKPTRNDDPASTAVAEGGLSFEGLAGQGLPPGLVYTNYQRLGLWRVDPNGDSELLTVHYDARLSPDQQQLLHKTIYFRGGSWLDDGDIWLSDVALEESCNLTATDAYEQDFQWWPANPGWILFSIWPEGPSLGSGYLGMTALDGSSYQVLSPDVASRSRAAPSPDGETIAYDRNGMPGLQSLTGDPAEIALDLEAIGAEGAYVPEWSPDGRLLAWIVYGSESDLTSWRGVGTVGALEQEWALIHRYSPYREAAAFAQLAWSPAGNWMAAVTQSEIPGEGVSLWVLSVDGQQEHHLGQAMDPVWSPDGEQLAFLLWPKDESPDPLTADVMVVEVGTWQPHRIALPDGTLVVDWVVPLP